MALYKNCVKKNHKLSHPRGSTWPTNIWNVSEPRFTSPCLQWCHDKIRTTNSPLLPSLAWRKQGRIISSSNRRPVPKSVWFSDIALVDTRSFEIWFASFQTFTHSSIPKNYTFMLTLSKFIKFIVKLMRLIWLNERLLTTLQPHYNTLLYRAHLLITPYRLGSHCLYFLCIRPSF